MNNRTHLLSLIRAYQPSAGESDVRKDFIELLQKESSVFLRTHFDVGHITGSALIVNSNDKQVLLNHHKSLDKWLCFGGHADGDSDILAVAKREVFEESGIEDFDLAKAGIFDLDIHLIPENKTKNEPAHFHYDIRYLFATNNTETVISDESLDVMWCTFEQAHERVESSGMKRLLEKAEKYLDGIR